MGKSLACGAFLVIDFLCVDFKLGNWYILKRTLHAQRGVIGLAFAFGSKPLLSARERKTPALCFFIAVTCLRGCARVLLLGACVLIALGRCFIWNGLARPLWDSALWCGRALYCSALHVGKTYHFSAWGIYWVALWYIYVGCSLRSYFYWSLCIDWMPCISWDDRGFLWSAIIFW